jgi:hypothetical protein
MVYFFVGNPNMYGLSQIRSERAFMCLPRFFAATAVVSMLVFFNDGSVWACSVCRGGDQTFFINNARLLPAGKWVLAIDNLFIERKALYTHPVSHVVSHLHGSDQTYDPTVMQTQDQYGVQAVFNYGLSNRLMLSISLPYVFNRITQAPDEFRITGLGDPEVLALLHLGSFFNNKIGLAASAGIRLPFGKTDSYDNNGFLVQPHDQIGSGAAAGIVGLQLNYLNKIVPIFLSGSFEVNGASNRGLRHGDVVRLNLAAQRRLAGNWDAIIELNTRNAESDRQSAAVIPHSGGKIIYLSPGVRIKLGSGLSFRGQVQTPVVKKLNGVQNEKTNFRGSFVLSL